jgi:hypothetical protein
LPDRSGRGGEQRDLVGEAEKDLVHCTLYCTQMSGGFSGGCSEKYLLDTVRGGSSGGSSQKYLLDTVYG